MFPNGTSLSSVTLLITCEDAAKIPQNQQFTFRQDSHVNSVLIFPEVQFDINVNISIASVN